MRPKLRFLSDDLIKKIYEEALVILEKLGIEIENDELNSFLFEHGVTIENKRAFFNPSIIEKCVKSAPSSFELFDVYGNKTHELSNFNVYFTPGSAAINILDYKTGEIRKPFTEDYIEYVKVIGKLNYIASQSTAFIPSDVPEKISDSYRLFLSLMFGEKPIVTGAFTINGFTVIKDLLLAIRGNEKELKRKPLAILSCCPTSPLKWSNVTSQNVIDCAKYSIPVEFISMPMAGFIAPVSLVGSLIQHTAETLSGIVISQLVNPGTPILYGGSPGIFDVRYETTPMGAIETMMIDCAYNEIGKFLNLPTQAYISLSDSKALDAQAGLETGMGAVLAVLSGINSISGPGMIDFESCQSLQKLILDNEICGMCLRLASGIEVREDFPSIGIFNELLNEGHLLISEHSRKYLKKEHFIPGPVISRANLSRYFEEKTPSLTERAKNEIEKHLSSYNGTSISSDIKKELVSIMENAARSCGLNKLPKNAYSTDF